MLRIERSGNGQVLFTLSGRKDGAPGWRPRRLFAMPLTTLLDRTDPPARRESAMAFGRPVGPPQCRFGRCCPVFSDQHTVHRRIP